MLGVLWILKNSPSSKTQVFFVFSMAEAVRESGIQDCAVRALLNTQQATGAPSGEIY